jgi:O-methyltransferase involved in polyketide biosynthesis
VSGKVFHIFPVFRILDLFSSQVVSLGAGFDSSYFRLQEAHQGYLTYVEVDFPDVVKNKWNIIQNDKVLSEVAKTGHYHLQAADLRDLGAFARLMQDMKLDFQQPTLFFSECSITYMDEPR